MNSTSRRTHFPRWLPLLLIPAAWPATPCASTPKAAATPRLATAIPVATPPGRTKQGAFAVPTPSTPIPFTSTPIPYPGAPAPQTATAPLNPPGAAGAARQKPLPALGRAKAYYLFGRWLEGGAPDSLRVRWAMLAFRRAAAQGLAEAQLALGLALEFGMGAPADLDEAEKLLEAAHTQGLAAAGAELANLQASALGLERPGQLSQAVLAWQARDPLGRAEARKRARTLMQTALEGYVRTREIGKARTTLLACLQEDPSYLDPRLNLAKLAEAEENWDGAIRWLGEALKLGPASEPAVEARLNIDRLRSIKELARTAAGLRKLRYDTAIAAGAQLLDTHAYGNAVAQAEEATRLDSQRFEAYSLLAAAYSGLHDPAKAQLNIQQAIARAVGEQKARLEKAAHEIDQDAAAEKLLEEAARALAADRFEDAGKSYEGAWQARPAREGYGLRAALAYQLGGLASRSRLILKRLLSSKDLAVSQAAANQLATLNAAASP